MNVELRHVTPLSVLVEAVRTCWDSMDKSDSFYHDISPYPYFALGPKDKKLIEAVIKKNHTSVLEHITFNFKIEGISRLVLQELARHRHASLSVKSTRYTLSELKNEREFIGKAGYDKERASKYINFVGNGCIDYYSVSALENLRQAILLYNNDIAKYALPESYKVDLVWSINIRSLQNFLTLRLDKTAHFEIQELARNIYKAIPENYRFVFDKIQNIECSEAYDKN